MLVLHAGALVPLADLAAQVLMRMLDEHLLLGLLLPLPSLPQIQLGRQTQQRALHLLPQGLPLQTLPVALWGLLRAWLEHALGCVLGYALGREQEAQLAHGCYDHLEFLLLWWVLFVPQIHGRECRLFVLL